jgi:hypothetical protein
MPWPTRGDVSSNVAASPRLKIVLGAIPGIRRSLPRRPADVRFDGRPHRLTWVRGAGLVRQPLCPHHLMRSIAGRWGGIALDDSVPRRHNPAVWIGAMARRTVTGPPGRILCRAAAARAL